MCKVILGILRNVLVLIRNLQCTFPVNIKILILFREKFGSLVALLPFLLEA